jgi:hypothetical protein
VSDEEIVTLLIRRSRRPEALSVGVSSLDWPDGSKSSGCFPENAAKSEVEPEVARESRASRDLFHHCRDRFHAIAGIITFTRKLQQNIIPNATRTGEGFTSFPRCYPTLMKVRETLTNLSVNR